MTETLIATTSETQTLLDRAAYWEQLKADAVLHLSAFAAEIGATINLEPALDNPYEIQFTVENIKFPDRIGHGTLRVMGYSYRGEPHLYAKLRSNRVFAGYTQNWDRGEIVGEKFDFCRKYAPGTLPDARQYADIIKGIRYALNYWPRKEEQWRLKGTRPRFVNSSVRAHPGLPNVGQFINS